jgi:hypothetical protein
MNKIRLLNGLLTLVAAGILLQTLYFTFFGQEQSLKLFTILDMEHWAKLGIGVRELVAAVLFLIPRTNWQSASLALRLMSGSIFFHFTKPGVYFEGVPFLFVYFLISWTVCLVLLIIQRNQILPFLIKLKK